MVGAGGRAGTDPIEMDRGGRRHRLSGHEREHENGGSDNDRRTKKAGDGVRSRCGGDGKSSAVRAPDGTRPLRDRRPGAVEEDEVPEPSLEAGTLGPDGPRGYGRECRTVEAVLARGCAGYERKPTAALVYDGMRAEEPTEEEDLAVSAWLTEAAFTEWIFACCQGACSLRMLVRALHRHRPNRYYDIRTLNGWTANRGDLPLETIPWEMHQDWEK